MWEGDPCSDKYDNKIVPPCFQKSPPEDYDQGPDRRRQRGGPGRGGGRRGRGRGGYRQNRRGRGGARGGGRSNHRNQTNAEENHEETQEEVVSTSTLWCGPSDESRVSCVRVVWEER